MQRIRAVSWLLIPKIGTSDDSDMEGGESRVPAAWPAPCEEGAKETRPARLSGAGGRAGGGWRCRVRMDWSVRPSVRPDRLALRNRTRGGAGSCGLREW